jgi:hypothetical protein
MLYLRHWTTVNMGTMNNKQYTIGRDEEKTLVKIGNMGVLGRIACYAILSASRVVDKGCQSAARLLLRTGNLGGKQGWADSLWGAA